MPVTILGPLQIDNVTTFAVVKFGDSSVLTPKNHSKASAGSGAFNTGGAVIVNTGVNATTYIDPDVIDQPKAENI
ncbi:spore germination protein [Neobacillus pocheonensis]|uniref:spore germination protein n=1 Tax=Neobacillus pocheonensis TaxID=363869 RepID=UPI003D2CC241